MEDFLLGSHGRKLHFSTVPGVASKFSENNNLSANIPPVRKSEKMSSQRVSSIKVPQFDKSRYNLWKNKMLLYIRASNSKNMRVLREGRHVPMKYHPELPNMRMSCSKSEWTAHDKELIALDEGLQLILVDSMDDDMSHQIMVYVSAKHMWEIVELLMEGTKDVKKNQLDILTSQYEAFKSLPGESITQVFERLNKLLNELSIHGKTYPQREVNRRCMLVLPHHLENKASSIRERVDFETITFEK
ncbi:hypothetical protein AgCh_028396 [Apium graveolens]